MSLFNDIISGLFRRARRIERIKSNPEKQKKHIGSAVASIINCIVAIVFALISPFVYDAAKSGLTSNVLLIFVFFIVVAMVFFTPIIASIMAVVEAITQRIIRKCAFGNVALVISIINIPIIIVLLVVVLIPTFGA